jgi:hypothetical protein
VRLREVHTWEGWALEDTGEGQEGRRCLGCLGCFGGAGGVGKGGGGGGERERDQGHESVKHN